MVSRTEICVAKTLRVHHLAKELGVASKDILAKCRAEGVELKNHMAAVSAGLAESIREWFSAGEDVTTVEVASPVDLTKVRKKPKAAKARQATESGEEGGVAIATEGEQATEQVAATAEAPAADAAQDARDAAASPAPAEAPAPEAQTETAAAPAAEAPQPQEAAEEAERVAAVAEAPEEAPPDQPTSEPARPAATAAAPPAPPEPVRPAGPQVVPVPAELKGPRVVRIEAPEPVRPPRPRTSRPAARVPRVTAPIEPTPVRGRGKGKRGEPITRSRSPRRRGGSADIAVERLKEWREQDIIERKERLAGATGHGIKARRSAERKRRTDGPGQRIAPSKIEITVPISVKEFSSATGVPFGVLFGKLMEHTGNMYKITDTLDADTAELLALDLGITLEIKREQTALEKLQAEFEARERNNLRLRPPVVAMLGHVDHGKTSLLDKIRHTHVAASEDGGITQHIGAYQVRTGDRVVTFLDTPGHEAFTAMRARGAHMTDVVVLVVAADDGVMPQTIEAINHARAAEVQIVVALNKIDLPGVDVNRVYSQLSDQGLVPSEWGGDTDVVKTSAVTGQGIDELITHLHTLAELMDLKADPTVPAFATVIEARIREGQGPVAQVLVREGTLKVGSTVVCGPGSGRVRALLDHRGKRVKAAEPGMPVELVGLDELPGAGDNLYEVKTLAQAKEIAEEVREQRRQATLQQRRKPQTLEDLLSGTAEDEVPELNVILKADVQGSVDVLRSSLEDFPQDKARLRILHAAVGAISEADVELARASKALLIGFHVVAEERAKQLAEQYGLEIRLYRVIYEIHDDLHKALEGLLEPEQKEEYRGKLEVREVFNVSRVGRIAGCLVVDGTVARSHRLRLIRDGRIVQEGLAVGSLRRFKDDVREVRAGLECGLRIDGYDDLKPGDVIEAYEVVEVSQEL